MSLMAIVLVSVGVLLLMIWLLCALSIVRGVRRAEQRLVDLRHVAAPDIPPRPLLGDVRFALAAAPFLAINVLVFVVGRAWYKVRGRPMPPWPQVRKR